MTNPYEIAHRQSIEDPDTFWGKAAEDCHWYKKWDKVLDDSNKPFYRWFSGGEVPVTMPWIFTLKTVAETRMRLSMTVRSPRP